ncbi:MAG: tRNA dihydrouridine synthase, partial [Syntrophothermus sp.]
PVTVKTRLGIDSNSIHILDNAKRIEDAGAQALVLHCRTRVQGHNGDADWSWINKVKDVVKFPVGLNGNIFNANDVKRAFEETNADAVMIARGAIGNPWIFREAKEIITKGYVEDKIDNDTKIKVCLRHLELAMKVKGDKRAILEHRKFYSGYLKGMYRASAKRQQLMTTLEFTEIEDMLMKFLSEVKQHDEEKKLHESQLL